MISDSNPDFRINPDPDVCRIAAKMYWIHSLVSTSHFAKSRKKYAHDCMRNANTSPKIPYSAMVREMEK